jgi:peptidoglycan/xylan/chitin deacetylase (PgdA/CDA1 family)
MPDMWRVLRRFRQTVDRRPEPVILMYHRVAISSYDPWGLSVSPQRFLEQLLLLKHHRIPLPMDEFVSRLAQGTLPRLAVGVTFDDGYRDNLEMAKPLLSNADIPATVFLTTGSIGAEKLFWWDELAQLILSHRPEVSGCLTVAGRSIHVQLPYIRDDAELLRTWRAWVPPRTARETLYIQLWTLLSGLPATERSRGMEMVRGLLHRSLPSDVADRPMRPEHVSDLVANSRIDIGAHTVTHPHLTALTPDEQQYEISRSRLACEGLTGKVVRGFAYPHGNLNSEVKAIVQKNGFRWACSTRRAAVHRSRYDPFDLPRIHVLDWTGQELASVLATARSDT